MTTGTLPQLTTSRTLVLYADTPDELAYLDALRGTIVAGILVRGVMPFTHYAPFRAMEGEFAGKWCKLVRLEGMEVEQHGTTH